MGLQYLAVCVISKSCKWQNFLFGGISRAPKSFHLCNVLAREEQVMCTSDPAGAFLHCLSYEVTTNNYVKGLQAACALLPLHNSQCIH